MPERKDVPWIGDSPIPPGEARPPSLQWLMLMLSVAGIFAIGLFAIDRMTGKPPSATPAAEYSVATAVTAKLQEGYVKGWHVPGYGELVETCIGGTIYLVGQKGMAPAFAPGRSSPKTCGEPQ